ncbi:putative transposase [Orientia tsutsugamushi str. Gilliam]|uniref:Transposase n=1 Tax=Orientia tsutsugamushi str. Gilliam TaxID=1359184 RepID=A0A0F3MD11_ORITS|nr:putative transposase [Orientia tsutsugamushi str. Gilliam]KJV53618.1 putative transposase [Orientia tsutsugamushi str. Gilliam]KJV53878.1 putative transposase [Orientia tsutsugamushi str. Gilliam]SPR07872.1 transposase [Orientia tsutsugamushi str. Gilliam]SPR08257.1 transposase [Orientia tsutsugamushi str. Gilliam]
MKSDMNYEVVLIDATETPIGRYKKNKNSIIRPLSKLVKVVQNYKCQRSN